MDIYFPGLPRVGQPALTGNRKCRCGQGNRINFHNPFYRPCSNRHLRPVFILVYEPLVISAPYYPDTRHLLLPFSSKPPPGKRTVERNPGNFSFLVTVLGIAALVMILAISSHTIIHPDTLIYHAQAVLWMEKYSIVPGTAHVDIHLGFQSWWFGALALFRFSFLADHPYLFVNGCIVAWFIFFLCERLGHNMKRKAAPAFAGWILLLAFVLLSWTQVRLTAASGSPDFVAALYIWGAVYFFMNAGSGQQKERHFLSCFFCCAAFGLKLSAIVILLLASFIILSALSKKRTKSFFILLLVVSVCTFPSITRNVISSGYPFFPSSFADLFQAEWKLNPEVMTKLRHYITAYARLEAESYEDARIIVQYSPAQWIPGWWHRISWMDKCLLTSILILAVFNLATIKRQIRSRNYQEIILFAISLAGCLTWFLNAPDPRFGTGFLIPMAYSLCSGIGHVISLRGKKIRTSWFKVPVVLIGLMVLIYIAHRLVIFFDGGQLLLPKGIMKTEYQVKTCQEIKIYVPPDGSNCGTTPVPCLKHPCDSILIIDFQSGFRGR